MLPLLHSALVNNDQRCTHDCYCCHCASDCNHCYCHHKVSCIYTVSLLYFIYNNNVMILQILFICFRLNRKERAAPKTECEKDIQVVLLLLSELELDDIKWVHRTLQVELSVSMRFN